MFVVAALYKFAELKHFQQLRPVLKKLCDKLEIKGTLLLAQEGINGTVAGTRLAIDELLAFLRSDEKLADLEHKESFAPTQPFYRMKVKLKKEIVTLGVEGIDPNKQVGTYLTPQEWNDLIQQDDVILIDTRNTYEYDIGTFKGAINPVTACFTEFPDYVKKHMDPKKNKRVAMFCTGGIRCEKSTAFMLKEGFEEVYHLKGGILKYLEDMPEEKSLWRGDCFVFDHRISVKHGLEIGDYSMCYGCRYPLSAADRASPHYEEGVCCPHCHDTLTPEKRHRFEERQKQVKLAKDRESQHIGASRSACC